MFEICTNITSKIINSFNISNLINASYKETKLLNKIQYKICSISHVSRRRDSLGWSVEVRRGKFCVDKILILSWLGVVVVVVH